MPGKRTFAINPRPVYVGNVSGAWTPDLTNGSLLGATLTGDVTINNPVHAPGPGGELIFYLGQDAAGAHKITWGSQFSTPAGPMPQINPATLSGAVFRFRNAAAVGGAPAWLLMGGVGLHFRETLTMGTNIIGVGGYDTPGAVVERGLWCSLVGGLHAQAAIAQWATIATLPTLRPHITRGVNAGAVVLQITTGGVIQVASAGGLANNQNVQIDGVGFLL